MIGQFKVKKTMWHNGAVTVGLAADYVADDRNTVMIMDIYKRTGKLKHPGLFEISGDDIRDYPITTKYPGQPPQHFVPLVALHRVGEELPSKPTTPAPRPPSEPMPIQQTLMDVPITKPPRRMV